MNRQDNQEVVHLMAKEFVKTMKIIVKQIPFDRTKKCRIVSHLEGKYYEVQLDNQIYKAYSPSYTYNENDIVYVKIAENNYNNLIIECSVK